MPELYKLHNQIKHYEWGSPRFIPGLLDIPGDNRPWAELWMGCHPQASSMAGDTSLDQLIAENPRRYLGEKAAQKYGTLPFLFKLLAAEKPLSIQAHPNLTHAREGFDRENRAALPLQVPNRNYKDANHKPELLCALTPFTGMCGFREPEKIKNLLDIFITQRRKGAEDNARIVKDALSSVSLCLDEGSSEEKLRNFLEALFNLSQTARQALTEYILSSKPSSPEWEIMRKFAEMYPGDPAVIAPLYLNVFHLEPGEAIFLKAGVLHAYISGFAVELAANSDNVLRGGLTAKHVDVPELMNILDFSPLELRIIKPDSSLPCFTYFTPCEEFLLTKMRCDGGGSTATFAHDSPAICIVTEGEAAVGSGDMILRQGESAFIPAGETPLSLHGRFTLYIASCPFMMKILVDADSCPREARELILRTAGRLGLPLIFAANRPIPGISGENVTMEICPAGDNSADNRIVELAMHGDLAVSRDLALAKRLLDKGVTVIDDRGRVFTRDNINELLSLRDFTVGLAENGLGVERTASYGKKERKAFADSLDRQLVKLIRKG